MNKEEKLKKLKERLEELKPIVSKGFKTDDELDTYIKDNQSLYNEYYETFEDIEKLVWELKTPEEKEKYLEQRRLAKLKREGKLL